MKISASLLSMRDNLMDYINKINNSSIDYIHLDIMDIDFVDNYSFNDEEINTIIKNSKKPLDVHLMVKDIDKYLNYLNKPIVEYITIHYEAIEDISIINKIRQYKKVGISVKPNTDITSIYNLLDKIDLVLIMSVEPGRGGQQFIESTYNKINNLKNEIKNRNLNVKISVDGGINENNINTVQTDIVVVGSYLKSRIDNKLL